MILRREFSYYLLQAYLFNMKLLQLKKNILAVHPVLHVGDRFLGILLVRQGLIQTGILSVWCKLRIVYLPGSPSELPRGF